MSTSDRLPVVNGLRGVAIAAVIWHHSAGLLWKLPPWERARALTAGAGPLWLGLAPLASGWLGVRLFFVLSGFVLMLPYARGQRAFDGWPATRAFYAHRARRLLPLFAIVVLVCCSLPSPASLRATLTELGMTLTGLFTFSAAYARPRSNPVLWSLGVELWLSAMFPWLARTMRRAGAAACVVIAVVVTLGAAFVDRAHVLGDVTLLLLTCVDGFVAGMAVACAFATHPTGARGAWALTLAGLLGAYLGSVLAVGALTRVTPPWTTEVGTSLATLGFAALLAGLVLGSSARLLCRLLANPLLQVAGMMCYSLYVWNYVILLRGGTDHEEVPRYALSLATLLALSALTYRYVEFGREPDARKLFRAAS